jgi:hypothetical protein
MSCHGDEYGYVYMLLALDFFELWENVNLGAYPLHVDGQDGDGYIVL